MRPLAYVRPKARMPPLLVARLQTRSCASAWHRPTTRTASGRCTLCEKHPCLVAEAGGRIVGFAYAHELRERVAFQWNAELSVYLAPAAQGRGAGRRLYAALIELLRLMGVKAVYGVVTSPNAASERLHRTFGFALMGVQPHAGFTCGAWHDVTWYVREIAPFEDAPAPPAPFPTYASAHPAQISEVIAQANESLRL